MIGRTIGHYRIESELGHGGMGVVYAARDLRLERRVALKLIRAELSGERERLRFWREARAAAGLNHPGICQVHEIGEERGQPFIVMELLEGETVAARVARGPLPAEDVVRLGLAVLEPLGALHRAGFVHRDLKPSNVIRLADGRVKLMDFGLARPLVPEDLDSGGLLTQQGAMVGSPRYMAPEQVRGDAVDARADLFSLAAMLHETATGKPLFPGESVVDVLHAVLHAPVPPLGGSATHAALGRVLERALAKQPLERHAGAEEMAQALRAVAGAGVAEPRPESGVSSSQRAEPPVVAPTRLAVLPFRMLKPDPTFDFLGPSLADAVAMSLAGLRSLVVRSPMAAARFAEALPDPDQLAARLDVNAVLTGTVLPADERCRVAAQLVEVPSGRVLWSLSSDVSGRDAFQLQDALTQRIVESLRLPLTAGERGAIGRDVPVSASAYELFLRANRLSTSSDDLTVARDLYLKIIEADPHYAPAWARLGRCLRLIGKFGMGDRVEYYRRAEEALQRALELHPDLPAAHYMWAQMDTDLGRPETGVERLLGVVERNPNDADGYAGLVGPFRYLGLIQDSVRAHEHARRLAPDIITAVGLTFETLGDYERGIAECPNDAADRAWMMLKAGRREELLRVARARRSQSVSAATSWIEVIEALAAHDLDTIFRIVDSWAEFPDPEGHCFATRICARLGAQERALGRFEATVRGGYLNVPLFERDTDFASLRGDPRFEATLAEARARHQAAAERFAGRI
jgi:non-specific serine/threonine protein kinase